MTYQLPVYQVITFKYGYTGKVRKRRVDQVITVAGFANAGVWIKARQHRVGVLLLGITAVPQQYSQKR
jgi:hypothetical protein